MLFVCHFVCLCLHLRFEMTFPLSTLQSSAAHMARPVGTSATPLYSSGLHLHNPAALPIPAVFTGRDFQACEYTGYMHQLHVTVVCSHINTTIGSVTNVCTCTSGAVCTCNSPSPLNLTSPPPPPPSFSSNSALVSGWGGGVFQRGRTHCSRAGGHLAAFSALTPASCYLRIHPVRSLSQNTSELVAE